MTTESWTLSQRGVKNIKNAVVLVLFSISGAYGDYRSNNLITPKQIASLPGRPLSQRQQVTPVNHASSQPSCRMVLPTVIIVPITGANSTVDTNNILPEEALSLPGAYILPGSSLESQSPIVRQGSYCRRFQHPVVVVPVRIPAGGILRSITFTPFPVQECTPACKYY